MKEVVLPAYKKSCTQTCKKIYTPVLLQDYVRLPAFLNCDYQKPCVTCATLTSLKTEFQTIYTGYAAPHNDTLLMTDKYLKEDALFARFLNYRTGFNKNATEYLAAYRACAISSSNTLCSFVKPANDISDVYAADTMPCRAVQTQAIFAAQVIYNQRKDSLIANFDSLYKAKCLTAKYAEQFYATWQPKEYHYTLYYYDQAGNLVKTMPPTAVKPNYTIAYLDSVQTSRNSALDKANYRNNEALATQYRYNSLNQVTAQKTPDAGTSNFWYDRLGRLAVSQNSKQQPLNKYSYTLYDVLGRITEVGQKPQATLMKQWISQDTTALKNWVNGTGVKEQITLTVYDAAYTPIAAAIPGSSGLWQANLRNRVSYTVIKDLDNADATIFNAATYYTYDIHGNVDTLLQDYKTGSMNSSVNRFKKFIYNYDLISGKVNNVDYQPGQADAFYHLYSYDAENRLTNVQTSRDKLVWESDARYSYYRHGPLARTVLGQNSIEGIDYAYTLQGWLKGINSSSVGDGIFDVGKDGGTGINAAVSRDVYGMGLNYFNGDYKTISNSVTPFAGITVGADLFNGNIKSMLVNIPKLGNAITYGFKYDQLNRLIAQDAYTGLSNVTNVFTAVSITDYKEQLTYDPNGNIKTYLRNGTGSSLSLNNYAYTYTANTNRLASITNSVTALTKTYAYDNIGNTTTDGMQRVTNAVWNVYGKLQSATNSAAQPVTYTYSADGQRISKKVGTTEEWYVRDASGNVMATYIKDATVNSGHVSTSEFYKYGSSLLGTQKKIIDVEVVAVTNGLAAITRGETEYLLTDHRGNNLAAISDKILQHTTNGTNTDYYLAEIRTASFYSSFGAIANSYNAANITLAHNGQRRSLEISSTAQTAEYWEYNSDIGQRNNIDPKPNISLSPYACFENNPIWYTDALGDTLERSAGGGFVNVPNGSKIEYNRIPSTNPILLL